MHLISNFTRDLSRHLEGTSDSDGLIQSLRPLQEKFKRDIQLTAPPFRPFTRKKLSKHSLAAPSFLSEEDQLDVDSSDALLLSGVKVICIDEVFKTAQM